MTSSEVGTTPAEGIGSPNAPGNYSQKRTLHLGIDMAIGHEAVTYDSIIVGGKTFVPVECVRSNAHKSVAYPIQDEGLKKWIVWWQGSAPERGDHIMVMGPYDMGYGHELAYLGDKYHDVAHAIVEAHNATVMALRATLAHVSTDEGNVVFPKAEGE